MRTGIANAAWLGAVVCKLNRQVDIRVVNPLGHVEVLSRAKTAGGGAGLGVILMPARNGAIATLNDCRFYVAGGITGLAVAGQDTGARTSTYGHLAATGILSPAR